MSANTILQDSLNKRKQEYSGQLMLMARKRVIAQRDIDAIDQETEKLEVALRAVQRAEGDWQAQQTAVVEEAKAQEEKPSDKPDEPKPGTQVK